MSIIRELTAQGNGARLMGITTGTLAVSNATDNDNTNKFSSFIVSAGSTISELKYRLSDNNFGLTDDATEYTLTTPLSDDILNVETGSEIIIGSRLKNGQRVLWTSITLTAGSATAYGI